MNRELRLVSCYFYRTPGSPLEQGLCVIGRPFISIIDMNGKYVEGGQLSGTHPCDFFATFVEGKKNACVA